MVDHITDGQWVVEMDVGFGQAPRLSLSFVVEFLADHSQTAQHFLYFFAEREVAAEPQDITPILLIAPESAGTGKTHRTFPFYRRKGPQGDRMLLLAVEVFEGTERILGRGTERI
jgi:hypothetical protein